MERVAQPPEIIVLRGSFLLEEKRNVPVL